jgi:hypothetical protein
VANETNQYRGRTAVTRVQESVIDQVFDPDETLPDTSEGTRIALLAAYRGYLESRRSLAQAFRDQEFRDQEAYRDAKRRYFQYAEAVEKAIKSREKTESDAANTYREEVDKAVDRATQNYQGKTKQVMNECKQKVIEAWKKSTDTSTEMTGVCEEIVANAMKEREKAEIDALVIYRQEVDRAIEKAAQTYKENMKQALQDCHRRAIEAWKGSMETSARMTSVFEEDGIVDKDRQTLETTPRANDLKFSETWQRTKKSFFSGVQRAKRALMANNTT